EEGEDRGAPPLMRVSRRAGVISLALAAALLVALPTAASLLPSPVTHTADAFYRAGAFVFGGGHVVLPLLEAEPAISAAVSPEQFLAGYGAAQAVPGPFFTFASYLGAFMGGGAVTALVALVAIFVPGFLLLIGVLPFWEQFRTAAAVRAALHGASAAVVGILAAALIDPVFISGVVDVWTALIALASFLLLAVWKVPAWLVVLLGAGAGYLIL